MTLTLRPFTPEDTAAVNALALAAYSQYREHYDDWPAFSRNLANTASLAEHGEFILAEAGGELVGMVVYVGPGKPKPAFFDPAWPIMRVLAVSPSVRGQGVGRLLVQACIDRALRDKAEVFALHTTPIMQVALAMYERLGFAFHGEAPPIAGVPYGVYVKPLGALHA